MVCKFWRPAYVVFYLTVYISLPIVEQGSKYILLIENHKDDICHFCGFLRFLKHDKNTKLQKWQTRFFVIVMESQICVFDTSGLGRDLVWMGIGTHQTTAGLDIQSGLGRPKPVHETRLDWDRRCSGQGFTRYTDVISR